MRVKYFLNGELSGWRKAGNQLAVHVPHPTVAYEKEQPLFSYAIMEKEVFIMEKGIHDFATTLRISIWKNSIKEMKNVQSICVAAMMTALNTLLGAFKISISQILVISFSSLAVAPCAMFCGPLLTGSVGAIADILKYMIRPDGPFFPGFTINEFLVGIIYGCFFYKVSNISWKRCLAARIVIVLLINMCLTPIWLNLLYGNSLWALVSARIVKNVVLLPIDTALLYFVVKTSQRVMKKKHA